MSKITPPKWFNAVVLIALVWNLIGLYFFLNDLNMSPEDFAQKPAAEQELLNNIPLWSTLAYALGVFGGSIGCFGLLKKKARSMMALLISLVAVIAQMGYWLFFTTAVEVYGPSTYGMPMMVILIAYFLLRLSNNGIKKGYLT